MDPRPRLDASRGARRSIALQTSEQQRARLDAPPPKWRMDADGGERPLKRHGIGCMNNSSLHEVLGARRPAIRLHHHRVWFRGQRQRIALD
jgi:hypothetical protein